MSLIIRCLAILTGLLVLFVMTGCSGRATIQEEDQTRSNDRTVRPSPTTKQVLPKGTPSTLEVNPPTATPTRAEVPSATPTQEVNPPTATPTRTAVPPATPTQEVNPPTATLTRTAVPPATPTHSPGFAKLAQPTEFVSSKDYGEFGTGLRTEFQAAVDNEFSALEEKAGISVAVYTNGKLWTYATGEADKGVDMTVETPLLISSTSKTFLSALILAQIEKGLYELTDPLGTVLANHPDFASFAPDKVIEEILTMSSGMDDFSYNIEGKAASFKQPVWTPSDTVKLIQSPFSAPGTFKYNDTNVVLLGIVAEFYAGESLADLYREAFLTRLNMTAVILPEEGIAWHTQLFNDPADDFTLPRMAMPYRDVSPWGGAGFGNMLHTAPFELGYYLGAVGRLRYGCCGIISTPENVARWAYELYRPNGSAISVTARNQLLNSFSGARIPPWGGTNESYGYFASKRTFNLPDSTTITAYGHPGGGGGYASLMRYSPELDLSISILANSEMSFRGSCGPEKPMNCIAAAIFAAYSVAEGR